MSDDGEDCEGCGEPVSRCECEPTPSPSTPTVHLVQVAFDPKAPALIGKLPEHWDQRRAREGKPDASRCAADLRVALEFTVRELRRAAHALQHDHEGDEYGLGMGRGLLHAANLISGDMTIAEAFAPKP